MRLTIAMAALLLSLSAGHAAVGDRFNCHVANVQSTSPDGAQDRAFLESNRQKNYEITILTDTIVTVFTFKGEIFSREYNVVKQTVFNAVASRTDGDIGTETIVISMHTFPQYGNTYPATVTVQSGIYVNAWALLCAKSN
jgi:hypothetical protein